VSVGKFLLPCTKGRGLGCQLHMAGLALPLPEGGRRGQKGEGTPCCSLKFRDYSRLDT
jgi:hypothetical protein